jgi:hypothetical protein
MARRLPRGCRPEGAGRRPTLDTQSRTACRSHSGASPVAAALRVAPRVIQLAPDLGLPLVTLIDTPGGALALLPADRVTAAQRGWLSPLPPEGPVPSSTATRPTPRIWPAHSGFAPPTSWLPDRGRFRPAAAGCGRRAGRLQPPARLSDRRPAGRPARRLVARLTRPACREVQLHPPPAGMIWYQCRPLVVSRAGHRRQS